MELRKLRNCLGVNHITLNSREVKKDSIFVALTGNKFDGNDYIDDALNKGASIILSDNKAISAGHNKIHYIEDLSSKLGEIAFSFYNKMPKNIIAVTGTNGKSSVVDFARQFFTYLDIDAATIGTMGVSHNKQMVKTLSHTTPDIFTLYQIFYDLSQKQCENILFEASSHGIAQGRINKLPVKIAVFTNLTQDHLDFHHHMESYFAAKAQLFSKYLLHNGVAIVNADSNYAKKLESICILRGIRYFDFGKTAKTLKILAHKKNLITINYQQKEYSIPCSLKGEFQIYNMICAISILLNSGVSIEDISQKSAQILPVAGRLEEINIKKDYKVFVDFAHTPSALENVLKSLRPYVAGRLILVFGCGGDRDKEKRPLMGKIAQEYSDYTIVTDDNPRNENPASIRSEILSELSNAAEVSDRKKAIINALNLAKSGDVVLIAGKGNENYQIIGDRKKDFNDAKVIINEINNVESR